MAPRVVVVRVELDEVGRIPPLDSADERITGQDARGAVIEIVRAEPPARGAAESAIGPEYLGASAIIDPSEPAVRAIAAEVGDGAADAWDRAQRLTRWVTEHMTFDAGIAFAPAAELARDRHGTCAGYAVLLASLLRAAHIPARLDMGWSTPAASSAATPGSRPGSAGAGCRSTPRSPATGRPTRRGSRSRATPSTAGRGR